MSTIKIKVSRVCVLSPGLWLSCDYSEQKSMMTLCESQGHCHQRQSLPGSPEMFIVTLPCATQSPYCVKPMSHGKATGRRVRGQVHMWGRTPSYSSAGSRHVNERVFLQMSVLSHGLPTPWSRVSYPCCVLQFLTLCIHGPNNMTVLLGHHVCSGFLFSNRLSEQCGKNGYFLSRKLGVHSQLQN